MKRLSYLLLFSLMTSCAQPKIATTLKNWEGRSTPYMQPWTGGIPGSGSGWNLFLPFGATAVSGIEQVYYREKMTTTIDSIAGSNEYVIARFTTNFNQRPDYSMNKDSKKEYGKKTNNKQEKYPFKLEKDEAVIKMIVDDKSVYIKIAGIEERSAQDLPARPQ